jgi:hypothetical protein
MLMMATALPLAGIGTASAGPEAAGREQLVLAINAAWVEIVNDGTYDAILSQSAFPGAPAASTYHTNIADCLPVPAINPYPGNPKGRFAQILSTGTIVRGSVQGGAPNVGDTASYFGPFSDAITETIIERIGDHYGANLTISNIVIPPPFFETTSVLVSTTQPRADFVDQVNATGGSTQGLVRRESRRFSCTLAASGQFIHVPARLAGTITSVDDLKAHPEIRICTGNLSTQTMNAYFPTHVVTTVRANDISGCDSRIAANTQDVMVNSLPSLSIATSAGLVLANTYTSIDTHIHAGTPLWVARENVNCTGSYTDAIPDNCTTGNSGN